MTLRYLLRIGQVSLTKLRSATTTTPSFPSFEAHVRSISDTWLRFPVGDRFRYSNLGIDLAGFILQTVMRKPFADCLRSCSSIHSE